MKMKKMEIELNKIKPNPYKKFINGGKLQQEQIDKLKESIKHGTLPDIFYTNKEYELCYGHHRLEALKQTGIKVVKIEIKDYSDEQMLIDLVRENLTQRFNEFREELDGVLLAKNYLEEHLRPSGGRSPHTRPDQEIGAREIAKFLSKDGKTICKSKVAELLKIQEKLSPKILEKVTKLKGTENQKDKEKVSIKQAEALSTIEDKKEQEDLLDAMTESREQLGWKQKELIGKYKKAPEEIKKKVRKKEIDLADVKNYSLNSGEIKHSELDKFKGLFINFGNALINFDLKFLEKINEIQNEHLQRSIQIVLQKQFLPVLNKLYKSKGKIVFEIQ